MGLETYTPDADDAQGLARVFQNAEEPDLPAAHPRFATAKYTYKPIVDELLALIARAYGRNKIGATISETIGISQDDWNPDGLDSSTLIRVTASIANLYISGLHAGQPGDIAIIVNVGSEGFWLDNESTASGEANRMILCSGLYGQYLAQHDSVTLLYDGVSNKWRMINRNCTFPPGNRV